MSVFALIGISTPADLENTVRSLNSLRFPAISTVQVVGLLENHGFYHRDSTVSIRQRYDFCLVALLGLDKYQGTILMMSGLGIGELASQFRDDCAIGRV